MREKSKREIIIFNFLIFLLLSYSAQPSFGRRKREEKVREIFIFIFIFLPLSYSAQPFLAVRCS